MRVVRRSPSLHATTLVLCVAVSVALRSVDAQASSSSSGSIDAAVSTSEELAQTWFTSNFDDNETQLAVGIASALGNLSSADAICGGVPSVQRRTDELPVNGGCPDIFSSVNASCTCLSAGFSAGDTWEFLVAKRSADDVNYPTAWNASDVLPIDSIRTLLVSSMLTTL
jgi:hypothetical protein